jgi:hypothetical protein
VGQNTFPADEACEAYSSSDAKDDISAATTQNMVNYIDNDGLNVTKELQGTALTYTGGPACAGDLARSFTINVYCDADLDYDNTRYNGLA